LPKLTVWAEGALFNTEGGNIGIASLPGLGAPFSLFPSRGGYEAAFGFDYRWPSQPWHFVFDFRFGRSKTASRGSSNSFSSFFSSTVNIGSGLVATNITTNTTANNTLQTLRESHLVADFMVGRDFGLGTGPSQLQFGIRVADLRAIARARLDNTVTTTSTLFYTGTIIGGPTTTTATTSTFATWKSRFFGAGPRVAIAGGIPIVGAWSFDYGGGIAALWGNRNFNVSLFDTNGAGSGFNSSTQTFVFNADALAALSYAFTSYFKASAGVRGDYYAAALTTYNINTGLLRQVDRLYWGPFVRLTGAF
jgi:hypothetical protein